MNPLQSLLLAANEYRLIPFQFPVLFQNEEGKGGIASQWFVALGLIALAIGGGYLLANSARLKDYGWKLALIFTTTALSLFLVLFGQYKLGVDLSGGSILVYEVDKKETASLHPEGRSDDWSMNALVQVIRDRLNPDGLKEIVVRPFGPEQIEIIVPETDPREIERIKEIIRTGGVLQFMVVASEAKDSDLFEQAQVQAARKDDRRLQRDVLNDQKQRIGKWVRLGRDNRAEQGGQLAPFRELDSLREGFIRDARTGEIIELTPRQRGDFSGEGSSPAFQAFLEQRGTRDVDVLLAFDPVYDLSGKDLRAVSKGRDQFLSPAIFFTMGGQGITKMGTLTQENLNRKLAIVFDNTLLSAPVIRDRIDERGEITGRFSDEEVQFIVDILKSGSMPVVLQKNPISENQIGSILGRDTIEKGGWSVVVALGVVLCFLAVYYRVAGLVACFALSLNLLITVGIMVLIRAPFTLPGLAGLVLTVAMSVDANVLISERIREELDRGAALRMAIRNGFDKALSAIIDGNLTTFLTALVLYVIGTDQIRGFGTTLMLGNITSMFTAIFCARTIFEFGERTRTIKGLSMANFIPNPKIDWVKYFGPAVAASLVLIVIGVVATVARGKGLFDTDLAGGTSVAFILKEATPENDVRQKLEKVFDDLVDPATNSRVDHNVYELSMKGQPPATVYKVDSSLEDIELLRENVREALKLASGQDGLKTFQMEIGTLTEKKEDAPASVASPPESPFQFLPATTPPAATLPPAEPTPATPKTPEPTPAEKPAETPAPAEKPAETPAEDKPAEPTAAPEAKPDEKPAEKPAEPPCGGQPAEDEKPAEEKSAEEKPAEEKPAAEKPVEEAPATPPAATPPTAETTPPAAETTPPAAETTPPATPPAGETPAPPAGETPALPAVPKPKFATTAPITFPGAPMSGPAVRDRLNQSAIAVLGQELDITLTDAQEKWDGLDNSTFQSWKVTLPIDKAQAEKVLQHAQADMADDVIWQTSSKIGGQVSMDTRWKAVTALVVSLLGIVAYVWFRFQKVAWGLAAVAALAHDALVMLTAIALSYWFASSLGFLGVEEFKISLPVVAAFLTLLGYSVNDTIVIFDRLREIRGKSPVITRQMLNDAVNQTLNRNIILAGITFTTVVILYIFGGPGIHAFAFALLVGVISGLYTTLVIASPLLLWLMGKTSPEVVGKTPREALAATAENSGKSGTLPKPSRTA